MPALPSEDIGTVLERFHKWAGNHAEPVRELTYEEAVKRSRRRVYDEEEPVPPEPAKAATPESSPQPSAASQPAATGDKAAKPRLTGKGKSEKKAAAAKPGRAGNKTTQKTPRKAAAQPSRKKNAAATPRAAGDTTSPATARNARHQAEEEIMPPSAPAPSPAPSFEQVLAAHLPMHLTPRGIAASTHSISPLPPDAPAVHLTVRLTAEERNAIRERAHDLGITPAAYLRHCGLEIDALRTELEAARLACAHVAAALPADSHTLEGSASLSLRRPAPRHDPAKRSWLKRLMGVILPGRAKGRTLSTSA